jgi:hypothetical protein
VRRRNGHGGRFGRSPTFGDLARIATLDRIHYGWPPHVELAGRYDRAYTYPRVPVGLGIPNRWPYLRITPPEAAAALPPPGALYVTTVGAALAHDPDLPDPVLWAARVFHVLPSAVLALPLVWEVPTPRMTTTPTYQPHYTLAFGGGLNLDGPEEWSCRLNFSSTGALPTDAEADAALPGLVAALTAWLTVANSPFGYYVSLKWVKFNQIGANGRYTSPGVTRASYLDPAPSAVNTSSPVTVTPNQTALVVSLRTAQKRGKAHAGRLYAPALGLNITNAGLASVAQCTVLSAATHALIVALNAAVPGPTDVSILSTTGEAHHVTNVAVGLVPDTMRSRRRSLAEAPYVTSAEDL